MYLQVWSKPGKRHPQPVSASPAAMLTTHRKMKPTQEPCVCEVSCVLHPSWEMTVFLLDHAISMSSMVFLAKTPAPWAPATIGRNIEPYRHSGTPLWSQHFEGERDQGYPGLHCKYLFQDDAPNFSCSTDGRQAIYYPLRDLSRERGKEQRK